jgi:starch synthase
MKVLFVASECAPLAKTGGLGDVVAGLAKELHRAGHEVRIILPLYQTINTQKFDLHPSGASCIHMGKGEEQWVGVFEGKLDGMVPLWLVDCNRYFGRGGLYHEPWGEYSDNAFRFGFFAKCPLQICKDRGFIPDIIHVHDWMSSMTSVYLKTWDRIMSPLSATASVLTIHNIGYQGVYDAGVYSYFGIGDQHFHPDAFEDYGRINLLKAGIAFSDAITTVSPTHAQEIRSPEGGMGLAPYLNNRGADVFGILNGIDYDHWDPATDPRIPAHFTPGDLSGKAICKAELQKQFGLEVLPDVPIFGIISRFAAQKGFQLLQEALPAALNDMAIQVVALGSGDPGTEEFFRWLTATYPGRAGCSIGFNENLSHQVEAGSDFFLMPSIYEPCGLNQIYSLKYGTLPVVRATGGLEDSVENYNEATGEGTGFKFQLPTARAVYDTMGWAVSTWYDRPHHIASLRKNAMAKDFSWTKSAAEYLRVYGHARARRLEILRNDDPSHPALGTTPSVKPAKAKANAKPKTAVKKAAVKKVKQSTAGPAEAVS